MDSEKIMKQIIKKIIYSIKKRDYKHLEFPIKIDKSVKVVYPEHTSISKNVILKEGVIIQSAFGISIGESSAISQYSVIYGKVSIGKQVIIGPHVSIMGGNHNYQNKNIPIQKQGSTEKGIVIKDDVWIGSNAVILDGVTIEKGAVVAAGAVVTKNVGKYEVAAGVPAKKINKRK